MNITRMGVILLSAASALIAQPVRLVGPLDTTRTDSLRGNVSPLIGRGLQDRGSVDPEMDLPYLTMHFRPTAAQQAGLERLLADQRDPASPDYHRWLTPEEFGDHFGLADADIEFVSNWLRAEGFQVQGPARGKRWLVFSGRARQITQSFRTSIHRYEDNGKQHYGNATAPVIPSVFEGLVEGIEGLHDFDPEPAALKNTPLSNPAYSNGSGGHFMSPEDLAAIYNFNPLYDGAGQKIAIGGRTFLDVADYQSFRKRFNLPSNNLTLLLVPGSDPGSGASADMGESNLDIQWASAAAPKADIVLVYSRSTYTSAQYAVDQNIAPVLSLSYGGCEAATSPSTIALLRGVGQQANAQGITWVASTGDVGAAGCERQDILTQATRGMGIQVPAGIPEITAVGGTEFDEGNGTYWKSTNSVNGGSAMSYIPEKAWNDNQLLFGLASGTGGMSTLFPKPAWQTGPGVPSDDARMVPDLSMAASWNHDGWITYMNGNAVVSGGTSVATPVFAGILTLLNQALVAKGVLQRPGLGNINPILYRMAQGTSDVFHDIVNGDNIVPCAQGSPDCVNGSFGYRAGPGYDLATGLGSINVANFLNQWNTGTESSTSVSAGPATVAYNSALTLTATVTAARTPTGAVNFLSGDTSLGSANLIAGGTASVQVSAFKLPPGNSTITAVYSGSTEFNGSSATTPVTVTLPATGSAIVPTITPDPVYKQVPDASGRAWYVTISLSERAGVATTLTGLRMLGFDYASQIVNFFGRASIPAKGTISASIVFPIPNAPVTGTFVFSGMDADGRTWSEQATATFLSFRQQQPWLSVSTAPGSTASSASTDPACQFQDQVTLQENGGYLVDLTKFTSGTSDLTSQIQTIFGTTHVPPYGTLFGTVCWNAAPAAGTRYTFSGTTESGIATSGTAVATAAAPQTGAGPFNVSPALASVSVPDSSQSATARLDLALPNPSAKWSLSTYPANNHSSWLTVSPASGAGPAQVTLKASGDGLSKGVYNAFVTIRSDATLPQETTIPVMFTVGAGGGTRIAGAANGASFQAVAAPGMVLSVFGTNLSAGTQSAPNLPLPIVMQGVTATVNGITAPLYYVSPSQINLQIPYETGAGPAAIGINNNGQTAGFMVNISASAPGIFTGPNGALVPFNSAHRGATLLAFITGEGDVTPSLFTGRSPSSSTPLTKLPKTLLPASISVGGVKADIAFIGIPPGLSGVTQVNFTLPATTPLGDQPVVVTIGGVSSPAARLVVNP